MASFNLDAFESYQKEQGLNAPVGEWDAFRYCTALNKLLADDRRRVQVGERWSRACTAPPVAPAGLKRPVAMTSIA